MPSEPSPIQIALTPRFKRDLRDLAKRYHSIRTEVRSPFCRVRSQMPKGVELNILTIWMVANGTTKFVTLVPDKGAN